MLPVEQPGPIEQVGLEHVERLHTVFHHQLQLARLGAVGKGPHIGTHGHRHAVLQLAVKLLHVIVEELVLFRRPLRRAGVRGKILLDGKGRNGVDLPFAHQAHGLVAQLVSMVDRGHSGLGGVQGARLTFTMHGNACLQARSLGDGLRQLRLESTGRCCETGRP